MHVCACVCVRDGGRTGGCERELLGRTGLNVIVPVREAAFGPAFPVAATLNQLAPPSKRWRCACEKEEIGVTARASRHMPTPSLD